jgi:type II secretory pathway component GspD/PulD (secretin)
VGTLTTGFILNMTPSIMDDDEIALQFSLDISTPPVLTTISSIQIPSFSGTQIAQRAKIREGETLVLSGFSLKDVGANRQGMFSPNTSMLLGGNRSSNNKTRDLVILITPIME